MQDVWQKTISTAKKLRKELHQFPELSWQEHGTARKIRTILDSLEIPWRSCATTGTLATLNPQGTGAHIGLRSDIDALPIVEQNSFSWVSQNSGCMHACGHDGHTATLLATAQWLKFVEHDLPGPVTLIFQPAEEGGHGAREMIADGALEDVNRIYGWHNWPAIPFGQLLCPDSTVMCGNGAFEILLKGKGGHASQPEICADPVLAASAVNLALQQIISRRLSPQKPAVLSVTSIIADSAVNVIPESAKLSGSIRIPDTQTRDEIYRLIEEISDFTAQSYGVASEFTILPRYNPTVNHADCAQTMREVWQSQFGENSLDQTSITPIMASEDFSYYLEKIPGAFALIGADDGPEHQPSCHSAHYDFNDALIPKVVRLFCQLAGAPLP